MPSLQDSSIFQQCVPWLIWRNLRRKPLCVHIQPLPYAIMLAIPVPFPTFNILSGISLAPPQLTTEAPHQPRCLLPPLNSRQLRVSTLHALHHWWLATAETSGSSFLPALFLKVPSVRIPSISEGLPSSLTPMPLNTATEGALSGQAARPPGTSFLRRQGQATPSCAVASVSKSHFPLCCCETCRCPSPFSASSDNLEENSCNYLGFTSGAIQTCLNVTAIFLPVQLLVGTTLVLA